MKYGYIEYHKKMRRFRRKGERQAMKMPDGSIKMIDTPDSDDYEVEFYNKRISHPWIDGRTSVPFS